MLLVKKCNDFHYLFSHKIGLEIRFNNIMNRKETFFDYKNKNFSTSQKWHFSKVPFFQCFWSKNAILKFFFSLKIKLKVRVNNVLDRKKNFFVYKNKIFHSLKNCIFPKGLSHDFGQKMPLFSLFVFGQNKTRNSTYFVQKNDAVVFFICFRSK